MGKCWKVFFMAFISVFFLPSLAFAYPDAYIFNNFLQGASPFIGVKDNYSLNSNGLWETYKPSLGQSDTILDGIVVSYSDDFMQGTTPQTAVPLVNLSKYGLNTKFVLPAGGCCVVTCDGDLTNVSLSSSIKGFLLGTTSPTDFSPNSFVVPSRYCVNTFYSDDTLSSNNPTTTSVDIPNFIYYSVPVINQSFVHFNNSNNFYLNASGTGYPTDEMNFLPYEDTSFIWFLYNDTSADVTLYSNSSTGPTITLDYVALSNVSWSLFSSSNSSTKSPSEVVDGRHVYFFPDIAGDIDVYTFMLPNETTGSYYCFSWEYSSTIKFGAFSQYGTSSYYRSPVSISFLNRCSSYFLVSNSEIEAVDGSNIPIFLNSAVRYVSSTAIMVNGGYININNYDELVALLKDNGIGEADLSRVIELLEEINTGGATGAEVKELMSILEAYHDQLMAQADFGGVTDIFEQYKSLLDFTDDMHWLITSNNALFGYFAGFILLCCMFLTISRILR